MKPLERALGLTREPWEVLEGIELVPAFLERSRLTGTGVRLVSYGEYQVNWYRSRRRPHMAQPVKAKAKYSPVGEP